MNVDPFFLLSNGLTNLFTHEDRPSGTTENFSEKDTIYCGEKSELKLLLFSDSSEDGKKGWLKKSLF